MSSLWLPSSPPSCSPCRSWRSAPRLATTGPAVAVGCGELGGVLATIRAMETGGRYDTRIATATASGAYAMIDAAWVHWSTEAGYPGQYAARLAGTPGRCRTPPRRVRDLDPGPHRR